MVRKKQQKIVVYFVLSLPSQGGFSCHVQQIWRTGPRGGPPSFRHLMDTLIQWNMHGTCVVCRPTETNLIFFLSFYKPIVNALQETNLGKHHNINCSNYFFYSTPSIETNGTFHSGTALIIDKTVPHKLLTLLSNLQATAARITSCKTITVCSIYLPPSQRWEVTALEELYAQLSQPALLGDFNVHSQSWGCQNIDRQCKLMEDFVLKQNLSY